VILLIWFVLISRRAAIAREERKNDIPKMLEFFKEMKTQNECIYYEIQLDENNVIQNVFWSHASKRAKYIEFGDVVTFDTTYQTNVYSMPLAIFVGSTWYPIRFRSSKSSTAFIRAALGEIDLDSTGGRALG
jgi:hypothetical protein